MFELSSQTINFDKENIILNKKVNLDKNLDCFILISSSDENLPDLMLNKTLDAIINKISNKNTYNDFSNSLEAINSFLKTWMQNNERIYDLDVVIWILNRNNFIFSNIGTSSCYLIKNNSDIIEITEKHENKKFFGYISSWDLSNDEVIILWTKRLLNYLSNSDLLDWYNLKTAEGFSKNIKNILKSEILDENVWVTTIKYNTINFHIEEPNKFEEFKHFIINLADNKTIKKIYAFYLLTIDYINTKSKNIKNIIFWAWAFVSFIILYFIISGLIWLTNNTKEKETYKNNLLKAKEYIRIASENITNPDIFELNIKKSEEIVNEIKNKELYSNDISKIFDDINIIKKQFNKVETYKITEDDILYTGDLSNGIKVVKNNGKYYSILKKSIVWPIIPWKEATIKTFDKLENNETFIDATIIWNNIFLLTSLSNIVSFSSSGHFKYVDVDGQTKWQNSKSISSYSKNIYLVWKDEKQIYKHKFTWTTFTASTPYINKSDISEIWEILSIWIDWGIYILQNDLSLIKMFKSPKYRLENIILNKLPKNYNIENPSNKIDIKTDTTLNYVYMLLNNKIWVFEPNTKKFQDTKSLTYIGQIKWNEDIIDFYINHDGEAIVLNKNSISKLEFEITEDRLIIR